MAKVTPQEAERRAALDAAAALAGVSALLDKITSTEGQSVKRGPKLWEGFDLDALIAAAISGAITGTVSTFRAFNSSDLVIPIGNGISGNGGFPFTCDSVDFDTDGQIQLSGSTPLPSFYNPATAFVCTNAGYYDFKLILMLRAAAGASTPEPSNIFSATLLHYDSGGSFIEEFDSDSAYVSLDVSGSFSGGMTQAVNQVINCAVGDYVIPFFQRNSHETSTAMRITGSFDSYFSGFRVGGGGPGSGIVGTGDFVGPAAAVAHNFVGFSGTTGKLGEDSGKNASSFDAAGAAATAQAAAIASANSHSDTNDAATLASAQSYTDGKVQGLSWKQEVRAATTANGTLATAFANGQVVDGVTLVTGDRILLKNQTSGAENGIYIVAASGAPARATDANTGAKLINATCYASEGTTNADTQWVCSNDATVTLGTTVLVFVSAGGGATTNQKIERFTFIFDGAGSVVASGVEDFVYVPFACTVIGWVIFGDVSGSMQFDIQKSAYAGYPPSGGSIVASDPPICTAALAAKYAHLTGWTTPIAADSFLRAVTGGTIANFKKVRLVLIVSKT